MTIYVMPVMYVDLGIEERSIVESKTADTRRHFAFTLSVPRPTLAAASSGFARAPQIGLFRGVSGQAAVSSLRYGTHGWSPCLQRMVPAFTDLT